MRPRFRPFLAGLALFPLILGTPTAALVRAQDTAEVDLAPSNTGDEASIARPLFLQLVTPESQDVEVAVEQAILLIQGIATPGAVVSVEGELADVDEQGQFRVEVALAEGANTVEVVASDDSGAAVATTVFVVRG
ncbi:MAG: hypothetical protein HYX52_09795 [Chloroflexi bacterium]|nr:hypothetical protein [Chloroflexota bacterium]